MKNPTEKHPRGADKVSMYNWLVVDKPGSLKMIDKDNLSVDHVYQRDPKSDQRVLELCSEWSWVGCGALVVASREDGTYAVIDGQHRLLAALRRSDIRQLPCIVFNDLDLTDEARSFLLLNSNRRPLSGVEKFKAQIQAGEHAAVVVSELAKEAGRKIGPTSDPYSIRCVACVAKHARENEQVLRRIWPVIVDVCRGNALSERIVESLMFIELRMPEGESLADKRWRSRVMDVGFDEFHASMTKFSAAYARGGSKIWALGVIEALNKGLRNRLVIRGFEKGDI